MRVEIYWNLHKGMWSVRDAKTRRVIGHAAQVLVRDATFKVSEAGRQRVLRERKKNVHAFVVGELEAATWLNWTDAGRYHDWELTKRANDAYRKAAHTYGIPVTYNPFKGPTFVQAITPEFIGPIRSSEMVYLTWETRKGDTTPRSKVIAFDPSLMTQAESERATA